MKILISRKDIRDTLSGAPRNVLRHSELFVANGHSVYVIAEKLDRSIISASGATPVKTFKFPISGYFGRKFYQKRVSAWVKRNKPDLVIGHGDIVTQDVCSMHNCSHLAHERIYGVPLPESDAVGRIHKEVLTEGAYRLLLCNSRMMKDDFIKRFNINPDKICVIYPEVELLCFDAPDPSKIRAEMRKKFNIGANEKVISLITSGNFKKRNADGLIRAFALLRGNGGGANIRLFIAKGDYKELIPLAEKVGARERVIFAPAERDIKKYYYMSDIFVLPARFEEFGRSVLEAMYCNLPALASKWVGASEIFEGRARDFILNENTPEEIAAKLKYMLNSPDEMAKLGEINKNTALKYSSDILMKRFYNLIKEKGIL